MLKMLNLKLILFMNKNFMPFNKTTMLFFSQTNPNLNKRLISISNSNSIINKSEYKKVLQQLNNLPPGNNTFVKKLKATPYKPTPANPTQSSKDANVLMNKVNYALLSVVNQKIPFNFMLGNLIYWGVPSFNFTMANKFFLNKKIEKKKLENSHMRYNSEMLLRYTKRNAQVTIHMPRIPSLIFKKHLLHRERVRQWNSDNSSDMLFGFGTGDCGFKPNETKTFIAKDTLVRAGLWIITRFVKKLSPIKLRFQGDTTVFRQYLNRLTPKNKKFKYFVANIEDSTPISFNGCKLRHAPRKRFRYHTNNFRNLVTYVKNFKDLKSQGMSSYKKYF